MATFNGAIFSKVLQLETGICVVVPQSRTQAPTGEKRKVLYLLHGYSDGYTSWLYKSNIAEYVQTRNIAVVMPEVHHSFYTDMKYGMQYFTYITQELPEICADLFPISKRREDTFVAGLSMGGYGAMKCALSYPNRYAGVAALSGALDMQRILEANLNGQRGRSGQEMMAFWGSDKADKSADLYYLADKTAKKKADRRPKIYMACGKQDFLVEANREFSKKLESLDYDLLYEEWDGVHNWNFWDTAIQKALDHLIGPVVAE